ncbi:hypothetical protein [Acetobacter malorum]|uniref:hypothetical protein n=1 Tax=Acetobacter malorum TaxID=178901 RepID=UPI000B26C54F|nr:hypothetical protein [Acetobacter malorum]
MANRKADRIGHIPAILRETTIFPVRLSKFSATEASCRLHGLPVQCLVVGRDLQYPKCAFPAAYGVSETGAVLVRADGFVVWKTVRANVFRHEDLLNILIAEREI